MTYLIGEIGQNHNGSVDYAKLLCDVAARPYQDDLFGLTGKGWDAVKLTKRDLNHELTNDSMRRPYDGYNSFGKTYGEHREFLELSDEEHFMVYQYAKGLGLDFVETLTNPGCLSLLKLFTPDRLKVASRDLTNIPLLEALAETAIPIIISTGMADQKDLDRGLEAISKYHENISILHCVSQYPTEYKNVNLNTITWLKQNYSNYIIGYSDHTIGIMAPIAAAAMGAEIIEKHITIDRKMKGTDQPGSLGIDGMARLVREIRNLDTSRGKVEIHRSAAVSSARLKLERSLAYRIDKKEGEILSRTDVVMVSPGDGHRFEELESFLGKVLKKDVSVNEHLKNDHFK